jgi:hypothetical protein
MRSAGIGAVEAAELPTALAAARAWAAAEGGAVLVCGSLFLAGRSLELLGAWPWPLDGRPADPNEQLAPGPPAPL